MLWEEELYWYQTLFPPFLHARNVFDAKSLNFNHRTSKLGNWSLLHLNSESDVEKIKISGLPYRVLGVVSSVRMEAYLKNVFLSWFATHKDLELRKTSAPKFSAKSGNFICRASQLYYGIPKSIIPPPTKSFSSIKENGKSQNRYCLI